MLGEGVGDDDLVCRYGGEEFVVVLSASSARDAVPVIERIQRALAESIPGVRAIDAGPLDNARLLESAAALLISLNLRHKIRDSGMRITGVKA